MYINRDRKISYVEYFILTKGFSACKYSSYGFDCVKSLVNYELCKDKRIIQLTLHSITHHWILCIHSLMDEQF